MRLLVTSGVVVAAAALGVSGCGGSGKTTSTAGTTLVSQATPAAAAAQGAAGAANGQNGTGPGAKARQQSATTTRAGAAPASTSTGGTTNGGARTGAAPSAHQPVGHRSGSTTAASTRTRTAGTSGRPRTSTSVPASTTPNWVNTTGNSQTTTIPASTASPAYVGRSPIGCLQAAGLNRARPGTEPYVWEANSGFSAEDNHLATVFLSGPYQDSAMAASYAQSLTSVEVAASGGRWVASAALTSGLGNAVNQVAACMAG